MAVLTADCALRCSRATAENERSSATHEQAQLLQVPVFGHQPISITDR
jgi:hypothetical protein